MRFRILVLFTGMLLTGIVAIWLMNRRNEPISSHGMSAQPGASPNRGGMASEAASNFKQGGVPAVAASDPSVPSSTPVSMEAPSAARRAGGVFHEARAYQLVLNGGTCRLERVEELRGDFKLPRAVRREAGMICCRLLDAEGRVLAEETMPAPDQVCAVLDPNVPDVHGRPAPAMLATGGETLFQTRLPKVAGAAILEVLRLSGGEAATPQDRPSGQVLAVIRLP